MTQIGILSEGLRLAFEPLLPWAVLAGLALLTLAVVAFAVARHAPGAGWRLAASAAILIALTHPTLVREQRRPVDQIALVVVDSSASQTIGARPARTARTLARLRIQAADMAGLDLRVVDGGGGGGGTRLYEALRRNLGDVTTGRVAGVVLITDGQVHDAPVDANWTPAQDGLEGIGPVHVLLTGNRDEGDRRLEIIRAARYGLVGDTASVTLRISDETAGEGVRARLTLRGGDGKTTLFDAPVNEAIDLTLPLAKPGANLFEFDVAAGARELSLDNNRAALNINAVRDRLRVLLISGQPHAGERAWRNLLKSDPAVDLVHFTILRPPEKQDATPLNELALIPFPIRELFEVKLDSFDLVIFDRYRQRGFLPLRYLDNVAAYVRRGGAVLVAAGPDFAGPASLAATPLADILPALPDGTLVETPFRPALAEAGRRHPVTAELGEAATGSGWGRWFSLTGVRPSPNATRSSAILMNGAEDRPLLILDRVGDGRVALLLSDHVWLWARGFEGGGPYGELMRRLAHWLMKEPDLEEDELRGERNGDQVLITRRSLDDDASPVRVTLPSGAVREVELTTSAPGRAQGRMTIEGAGLYRLEDARRSAALAVAAPDALEIADPRATATALAKLAEATGGGILWLGDGDAPDLRRTRPGRALFDAGSALRQPWIGLPAQRAYDITGLRRSALIGPLLLLIAGLGALLLAWRREGR